MYTGCYVWLKTEMMDISCMLFIEVLNTTASETIGSLASLCSEGSVFCGLI